MLPIWCFTWLANFAHYFVGFCLRSFWLSKLGGPAHHFLVSELRHWILHIECSLTEILCFIYRSFRGAFFLYRTTKSKFEKILVILIERQLLFASALC